MNTKPAVQLVAIVVFLVGLTTAQEANCSFSQYVQPAIKYYIYGPNYPNSYGRGRACRWVAAAPANYNVKLECDVRMPQSIDCTMDRLLISRTGDLGLAGADKYCGTGTFTFVSDGTQISVGLLTSPYSTGGNFYCLLTAVAATVKPPCNCGWSKSNRIVGGVETDFNEFPYQVGIIDTDINLTKCGGVIISRFYVLTAGHCLLRRTISSLKVIAGAHNIRVSEPQTQTRQVSKIIIHENINTINYNNDIGILKVAQPFVFNDVVGPICLPFKYASSSFVGSKLTVLGWGTLFPGGPTSGTLQKAPLDVMSNAYCQSQGVAVTPSQLCTYTPGKDACQDDSGGPMIYTESGTGTGFSAAIVSYGALCAQYPAVSTRTTSYIPWILANTPDGDYCRK